MAVQCCHLVAKVHKVPEERNVISLRSLKSVNLKQKNAKNISVYFNDKHIQCFIIKHIVCAAISFTSNGKDIRLKG